MDRSGEGNGLRGLVGRRNILEKDAARIGLFRRT
jgi:hypothetical protein